MGKADFQKEVELNKLKKENTTLKNKLENFNDKIIELENTYNNTGDTIQNAVEKLKLSEVKLTSNIRDDYEQIEQLAIDILTYGQLQPILLTKDNYLLTGYRRFNAIQLLNNDFDSLNIENQELKSKIPNYLVAYRLDFNLSELSPEQIDEMQFSENEQRKSLDNFQISKLFNKYLEKGYEQKYICEKFKKKKSYVSSVISLKNVDSQLVQWIKEFQIYAWSYKKFCELTTVNSQNFDEKFSSFYEKNKGIIGWNILYHISRQLDLAAQKKYFLKLFHSRLTEEEINSDFFNEVSKGDKKLDKKEVVIALKQTKSLSKRVKNLYIDSSEDSRKVIDKINKNLNQVEAWLEQISSGK